MSVSHVAPMSMIPAITPEQRPTSKTQSQPDQASWAPRMRSQKESFFFLTMCRWRIRSLAMSLCQSIVWKSSYCPIPASGRSSPPDTLGGISSDPPPRLGLGKLRPLVGILDVVPECCISSISSSELFTDADEAVAGGFAYPSSIPFTENILHAYETPFLTQENRWENVKFCFVFVLPRSCLLLRVSPFTEGSKRRPSHTNTKILQNTYYMGK